MVKIAESQKFYGRYFKMTVNFRKYVVLLLIVMCILSLVACSDSNDSVAVDDETTTEEETIGTFSTSIHLRVGIFL